MTICALAKGKLATIIVADGRLSRDNLGVSFDTVQKLSVFSPRYIYPVVSVGRFERWAEWKGQEWCIAYSGTYALATQIRDTFLETVCNMIVVRNYEKGGRPDFVRQYTPSQSYGDDYNFDGDEFPELDATVILDELKLACQVKGDEWASNRLEFPDVEFLLFGASKERADFRAFQCSFDVSNWRQGEPVIVRVSEVGDMAIACIGAPEAASAIAWDETLAAALRASVAPATCDDTLPSYLSNLEPSKMTAVEARLIEIIRNATDSSVGGRLIVAVGSSNGRIRLRPAQTPRS